MKAPTADYSPLSQALSAKSNAIQASYSAKDASNWKSNYDIQQKSFGLQQDSLDLQQESIDLSRQQTNVSGALDVFNGVLNLADTIVKAKQSEMEQTATADATKLASDVQSLLDSNPDLTSTWQDDDGITHVGLTDKGKETVNKYIDEVFPENKKYGWGMTKYMQRLRDSIYDSADSYSQNLAVSRTKGQMEAAYSSNLQYALEADLKDGDLITKEVEINDGAGGTRTVNVGVHQAAVIESRSATMGKEWTENQYAQAAKDLITARGSYITADVTEGYSNGTYILDAAACEAEEKLITEHLEQITDPTERAAYEKSIKEAISTGTIKYFTDQASAIMAQDKDSYTTLSKLYDSVATGEALVSAFSGKYMQPSTLSTVRTLISEQLTSIESTAGTTATNIVSNGLKALNTDYQSGKLSAESWSIQFSSIMQQAYGDDWQKSSEAMNVYNETILGLLGDDFYSSPEFMSAWKTAYQTMLNIDTKYDDLSAEQQSDAMLLKKNMYKEVTEAVLADPTVALDPVTMYNKLKDITAQYTPAYLDILNATNKAGVKDTLSGTPEISVFSSNMEPVIEDYSDEIISNVSTAGYWDRSHDNLLPGVNDEVSQYITNLGAYGQQTNRAISDPASGMIQFEVDEDGNPVTDNGKLNLTRVVWPGEVNGKNFITYYDFETKKWGSEELSKKTPVLTDLNKDLIVNNVALSAAPIADTNADSEKGTNNGSPVLSASESNVDKTVSSIVENNSEGNFEKLTDILGVNCNSKPELVEAISGLQKAHKAGTFMPNESDKSCNDYLDSVKISIAQKKGWDISSFNVDSGFEKTVEKAYAKKNEDAGDIKTDGNKTEEKTEEQKAETTAEWVKANPKPSGEDVMAYLESVDDVEKAVSELRELSKSKALTINPQIRKLIDQYLKDYRKSNKNK